MSGLMQFNHAGAFQQSFDAAQEKKKASGLAALMGEYAAGGQPDYRGIAANGGNPLAVRQDQQGQREHRTKELGQLAGYLASLPAEARPGAYQAMLPKLSPIGQELGLPPLPPQWDESHLPELQQIAQQWGGAQGSGSGVQSSFVDAQGRRMAIMRDGSVRELGQNAPNNQIIDTGNGFYGVNKGNLSAAPVMVGQGPQSPSAPVQAPQQAPAPGTNDGLIATANQMIAAGVPDEFVQKWMSQQPGIGPASDASQGAVSQQPAQASYNSGAQLRSAPKPVAAQAPTELQRRVEMARQMGATPEQIKAMVVGGGQTGNAQAQKAGQGLSVKMAQLDTVQRQIDRLDKAAQSVAGNKVFDGGPLDQYAVKFTAQGQELEQSAAAIMPVLTALTRVPGVGAQSDLESRLAALQLPNAGLMPEVNKAAVKALREYMADLKKAYQGMSGGKPPAVPSADGKQVKRTGSLNGRKVVEYTDGTTAYAD